MRRHIAFLIGLLLAGSLYTNAESLKSTALRILTESPEYLTETYSLESVKANLKTESNLPDPELGGEYLVAPVKEDNRWAAELNWGIEWPGVYSARGKEGDMKINAARENIEAQRAERLAEITDLLLDYVRCRKKLALLDELSQNNDAIYHLAEQATKGGELTVLDLNKVKLEYANIRVAKATLIDEEAEIIAGLSQIYGKDCTGLLGQMECAFPAVTIPSEAEIAAIKDTAPAVKAAMAEAEAARKRKDVAKMEALPSLSVGYKHAFEEGTHFNGATLGISIPMFSSRGKQKAAKADILEAEIKAEAAAAGTVSEAMASYRRLKLITEQIAEIAPIVENSDYNATLLKAYEGGLITLIDYIAERNFFTNAAIELVGLRHNAAKAMAFLERYLSPTP